MLLDIEAQLGELAIKEEKSKPIITRRQPDGSVLATKQDKPPKHERLGISPKRMAQAEAIHKHPEIVEKVKAQARENEDIPTRTVPGLVSTPFYGATDAQEGLQGG